jgi:orotidine-5'-phosphate decarboxylase
MTLDAARLLARLPGRSAEEAVRAAKATAAGVGGFAVGVDLLAGPGAPLLGAIARIGPVASLWAVHGDGDDVASACARLAEFGATWIAIAASSGSNALAAGVAATSGTAARVAAYTVEPDLDDAAVASLGLGRSRGAAVSRAAKAAHQAGVTTILCATRDLGVVAQVAESAETIVVGARAPGEVEEALDRGATFVVVPLAMVG